MHTTAATRDMRGLAARGRHGMHRNVLKDTMEQGRHRTSNHRSVDLIYLQANLPVPLCSFMINWTAYTRSAG